MLTDAEKRAAVKKMTEALAAQGQVIEGGWCAYEYLSLKDCSDLQRKEMRKAFFFGAQHLFASVLQMLDPGMEPTDKDMERMTLLDAELKKFVAEQRSEGGFAV